MATEIEIKLARPHIGQMQVLEAFKTHSRVSLCCGRRWGKSLIARQLAILTAFEKKDVGYVTPKFNLAKKFFKEIVNALPTSVIKSANKSDLIIETINGGTITFFSGESMDNVRSHAFHLFIIDEASFIPHLRDGWVNAIEPTLIDYDGKALIISTPRGKDYFFELCNIDDPEWINFNFPSQKNPFLTPLVLENLKKNRTKEEYNTEILAIAGENSNAIVSGATIERNTLEFLSSEPTVVFGIDIGSVKDWTVISGLDANGHMSYFDRFRLDYVSTMAKLSLLPQNVVKVLDATGSGKPVYDVISLTMQNLVPFYFTTQSKPILVKNFIIALETDSIKVNQETADEIGTYEGTKMAGGYTKYNAISGMTDDCVDATMLAYSQLPNVSINENWINRFSF